MLTAESRPRELSWRHAGPLLFGDWGTSRLYVLGLAFYATGHASIYYLIAMAFIMASVAWAYTVVCRCFPDGGGVYTAARPVSKSLSVIGATLLLCDFIVTAALSAVEGFHYFGLAREWTVYAVIGTLILLGFVNALGAKSAGRLALVIAVLAIVSSAVIGVLCVPYLREGLSRAVTTVPGVGSGWDRWQSLVRIVLALSGVEAVANMTGMMKLPVAKTAKRTIWPVLIEVIILNTVFAVALNAVQDPAHASRVVDTIPDPVTGREVLAKPSVAATPDHVHYEINNGIASEDVPEEVKAYRDTAVKLLALDSAKNAFGPRVGHAFGIGTAIVFGLLLISAVNTAILAMVSVMYALARDGELPRVLTRLNYSGVPWVGLVIACGLPVGVLLITSDVNSLGELYAIGVVGAITINFFSCAWNKELPIKRWERGTLWTLAGLMTCIELTIIVAKPHATIFAGFSLAAVLGARFALRKLRPPTEVIHAPQEGWLAELAQAPLKVPPDGERIMLAVRGTENIRYAVDRARKRGAVLFGIYVRVLRVLDAQPGTVPKIEDDPQAQQSLGMTAMLARQAGVPFFPIYINSTDIVAEVLDYTVTFGCDELIMGKSRRSVFSRALAGDVVAQISRHLPEEVSLITRAGRPTKILRQPIAGDGKATSAADEQEVEDEDPPPS